MKHAKYKWNTAFTIRTIASWLVALVIFFPIFFMGVTAFKTELEAIAVPSIWSFEPTLENFYVVQERSDYVSFAINSLITSVASTVIGLLIAAPAAYSMAFFPTKRTKDILMWMLSTKMMPAVGALIPIYVIFQSMGMLDTLGALTIIFTLMNLPIMVWMLYSYFKDIPNEILEAARMDGAGLTRSMAVVALMLSRPMADVMSSTLAAAATSSMPAADETALTVAVGVTTSVAAVVRIRFWAAAALTRSTVAVALTSSMVALAMIS